MSFYPLCPRATKGSLQVLFTKDYKARPGGTHLASQHSEERQEDEGQLDYAKTPSPNKQNRLGRPVGGQAHSEI